jgi:hypothetical protein
MASEDGRHFSYWLAKKSAEVLFWPQSQSRKRSQPIYKQKSYNSGILHLPTSQAIG